MPRYYYSDPSIGRGFSNLAQAIAGDPIDDVRARALAEQANASAAETQMTQGRYRAIQNAQANLPQGSRYGGAGGVALYDPDSQRMAQSLATLMGLSEAGTGDTERFADITAMAGGNPQQGRYGIDTRATTERRGQDLDLAGTRYTADQRLAGTKYGADRDYAADVYDTDARVETGEYGPSGGGGGAGGQDVDALEIERLQGVIANDLQIDENTGTTSDGVRLAPGTLSEAATAVYALVREGTPYDQALAQVMGQIRADGGSMRGVPFLGQAPTLQFQGAPAPGGTGDDIEELVRRYGG